MDAEVLKTVKRVHNLFRSNGLTLSVAESCTGGLISHYLTCLPGSSYFFKSGVVTYSEEAKRVILGISSSFISRYGVVSAETAEEMAERIRLLLKSDYTLSTTGNLGPGVIEGTEKGLVYMSVSKAGKTYVRKLVMSSGRIENKEEASLSALRFLIESVEGHEKHSR
jgi:PncC family amidohydrolase